MPRVFSYLNISILLVFVLLGILLALTRPNERYIYQQEYITLCDQYNITLTFHQNRFTERKDDQKQEFHPLQLIRQLQCVNSQKLCLELANEIDAVSCRGQINKSTDSYGFTSYNWKCKIAIGYLRKGYYMDSFWVTCPNYEKTSDIADLKAKDACFLQYRIEKHMTGFVILEVAITWFLGIFISVKLLDFWTNTLQGIYVAKFLKLSGVIFVVALIVLFYKDVPTIILYFFPLFGAGSLALAGSIIQLSLGPAVAMSKA